MTAVSFPLILCGYFLGSLPFGVWISRTFYQTDIVQHGSKNTGATNVWRVLGWKAGVATLLLDGVKGAVPVLISASYAPASVETAVLSGLAAILGHNWSLFLKGRGGKGVATSAGVFLALMPAQALVAILSFLVFFGLTRFVSVGSMAGAMGLVAACYYWPTDSLLRTIAAIAALLLIVKHKTNIRRLIRGEEPKVRF